MDENKVPLGNDEFHFSEAEEVVKPDSPYAADTSAYSDQRSKFNRRNILIVIGIIALALSVYKLIEVFRGAEETPATVTTAVTPTVVPEAPKASVQIQAQPSTLDLQADLQKQLAEIQANNTDSNQQISTISDQLTALGTTVENLNNSVTGINQQLQELTSQVQAQQSTINKLQKKATPVKHHVASKPVVLLPTWQVQALIPGRAWLIADNGDSLTVSVGTPLPGYGRITAISVVNGFVKTSTGAILHFRGI